MLKNLFFIVIAFIWSITMMVILEVSSVNYFLFIYILSFLIFIFFKRKLLFNSIQISFTKDDFFTVLFFSIIIPIIISIISIKINKNSNQIEELVKLNNSDILWSIFIAPIIEELFFRKLLMDLLEKIRVNFYLNIIFTSILFGISHGISFKTLILISIGTVYAYLYLKTKNLVISIVLHTGNNLSYVLMTYYNKEMSALLLNLLFPLMLLTFIKVINIFNNKASKTLIRKYNKN